MSFNCTLPDGSVSRDSIDAFFLLSFGMIVFFLQAGFAMLEAGCVSSKNVTVRCCGVKDCHRRETGGRQSRGRRPKLQGTSVNPFARRSSPQCRLLLTVLSRAPLFIPLCQWPSFLLLRIDDKGDKGLDPVVSHIVCMELTTDGCARSGTKHCFPPT